jgi:outer membrane protein OmpA-like peptidoglycan-associated protein
MKTQHLLFFLLGIMVVTKIAYAQDINFGKQKPSTNQVIDALSPDDTEDEGGTKQIGKSRSIDMSNLEATPKASKKKVKKSINTAIRKSNTKALSMQILFGYNSAELTAAAQDQLKPVGEALASEKLQNLSFVVEGHTDAIGGYDYNKSLSEERAASVKQFLVDMYHINPSRIQIIGKGKSNLFDPKNPASEVNRRVRIITTQ